MAKESKILHDRKNALEKEVLTLDREYRASGTQESLNRLKNGKYEFNAFVSKRAGLNLDQESAARLANDNRPRKSLACYLQAKRTCPDPGHQGQGWPAPYLIPSHCKSIC